MHKGNTRAAVHGPITVDELFNCLVLLTGILVSLATIDSQQAFAAETSCLIHTTSTAPFVSEDGSVSIRSDFHGGRLDGCVEIGVDKFDLLVKPERVPVNNSAWYAFQISSTTPKTVQLRLHYEVGTHRYHPRLSHDRKTWTPVEEELVRVHPLRTQAIIELTLDERPLWIAGQELLTEDVVNDWTESLLQRPYVTQQEIGRSVQNRPIRQLEITESKSPSYLVILARQHPPEVSGAIGMMRFVDAIAAETPVARKFRKQFSTIVIPTSNPDGVANGHWRCNANGVDLNRDWGHFRQPETRAIGQSILGYRSRGRDSLHLVLDFHSTYEDVFYTTENADEAFPKGFATQWLNAIDQRFSGYAVNHDATHNASRSTSKAWAHRTLDVAAVTYEFGDHTDRSRISDLAQGSAEEMMYCLLRHSDQTKNPSILIGLQSGN